MIIAAIMTLILGPLAFLIISRAFPKKGLQGYPTGINDGIGDTLFIPLFNYALFSRGVSFGIEVVASFIFAGILLSIYAYFDLKAEYKDWSKPKGYSFGGYYHLLFMFIEGGLMAYGLLLYHTDTLILISLAGYLLTVFVQFLWKGRI